MAVVLRPIDGRNWREAIRLSVAPEQRVFVASNVYSIAESKFEPEAVPMGIYAGDTMVGFLMFGMSGDEMWVWRLMVDHGHQRRGYGRAAMAALIDGLRAMGHHEVFVSYKPENDVAAQLYASLGFEDTGRVEDGEIVVHLFIDSQSGRG
jgi:diamine N-acetyltransferase